jgi:hypothetical protein
MNKQSVTRNLYKVLICISLLGVISLFVYNILISEGRLPFAIIPVRPNIQQVAFTPDGKYIIGSTMIWKKGQKFENGVIDAFKSDDFK